MAENYTFYIIHWVQIFAYTHDDENDDDDDDDDDIQTKYLTKCVRIYCVVVGMVKRQRTKFWGPMYKERKKNTVTIPSTSRGRKPPIKANK